jgi:hypothetical protein
MTELKSSTPVINSYIVSTISTLMRCLHDQDITFFLNGNENIQENVENLYFWMVENSAESRMFEAFGMALSNSSLNFDISLIQKFRSRAIYEERRQCHVTGNFIPHDSDLSSDDDEI